MKIRKIQLARLLENLMQSYNVFTNKESLQGKVEGWYDKLQYQEEEFVSKAMRNWNGTKMPTAVEILNKCFETHVEKNRYPDVQLFCQYDRFTGLEEECDISKSLCENKMAEKSNTGFQNVDLNGEVFMVCTYHKRKLMADFENNEYAKIYVDSLILFKKQEKIYDNNLHSLTQDLTTKIMVS